MSQIIERVYNGRDNTNDLLFMEDGVAIQHSEITRVVVTLNDPDETVVDSDIDTGAFAWTGGQLTLSFGGLGLPIGGWDAYFVIYTLTNTNGIMWQPFIGFEITAE